MQENFRTAVNKLKTQPLIECTDFLGGVDSGFETFAHAAEMASSLPSLIVTNAAQFGVLIPECMHNCPAFVMWLPSDFSDDIEGLAHTTPFVYGRTSPDLQERNLMLGWGTSNFTFVSFAGPLLPSIRSQQGDGAIPMIFATATSAAVSVLPVNSDLLDCLSHTGSRCDENFYPKEEYSTEWLRAASKRRRDPFEFELDPVGRRVVLLRPRRAQRSVRVV